MLADKLGWAHNLSVGLKYMSDGEKELLLRARPGTTLYTRQNDYSGTTQYSGATLGEALARELRQCMAHRIGSGATTNRVATQGTGGDSPLT